MSMEDEWSKPKKMIISAMAAAVGPSILTLSCFKVLVISVAELFADASLSSLKTRLTALLPSAKKNDVFQSDGLDDGASGDSVPDQVLMRALIVEASLEEASFLLKSFVERRHVVDCLWVQLRSVHDTDTCRLVCGLDCHSEASSLSK